MNIAGIQRTSTIDFPQKLSAVLFTRGCDLDCFYCHNRALLNSGGPVLPWEEVLSFLQKRQGLLDGIVVSGGEPTLQSDLLPFLQLLKDMGYAVKLDTNGQRPEVIAAASEKGLLDFCAVDVKALPTDYPAVCGKNGFNSALETLSRLIKANIPHEARTTVYPGLMPQKLIKLGAALPQGLMAWRLNVFHMPAEYPPALALQLRRPTLTKRDLQALFPSGRTLPDGGIPLTMGG